MEEAPAPDDAVRWWLNLQISFGLLGGVTWFAGVVLGREFVSGVGLGLIIGALLLRFARRSAARGGE